MTEVSNFYQNQSHYNNNKMALKSKSMKGFFSNFEMFPAQPILRIEEETSQSSLFTGFVSFITVAAFLYILVNKIIDIVTYQGITSVQTQSVIKILCRNYRPNQYLPMIYFLQLTFSSCSWPRYGNILNSNFCSTTVKTPQPIFHSDSARLRIGQCQGIILLNFIPVPALTDFCVLLIGKCWTSGKLTFTRKMKMDKN